MVLFGFEGQKVDKLLENKVHFQRSENTIFPHIVSTETILFCILKSKGYNKCAEII